MSEGVIRKILTSKSRRGVQRSGGGGGVDVTIAQGIKMMRLSAKIYIRISGVDIIKKTMRSSSKVII